MSQNEKRTALVTGASSGIGAAIAETLARDGVDLVVTARRRDRLEALAKRLTETYQVKVMVEPADLCEPEAPQRLWDAVTARGVRIDVLVNNAGFAISRTYERSTWAEQARFLQLVVTASAQLTHLALSGMRERGYGRVLLVSSVAAFLPGSIGNTLYGAAKAFLVQMAESLALELELSGKDIKVSVVCPGFTRTEMHDLAGNGDAARALPGYMWMDADVVAREAVQALMRGRTVLINGAFNRAVVTAIKLLPASIARRFTRRESKRLLVQ